MASPMVVGFVGLDELSLELASSLVKSGYRVQGYEVEVNDPEVMNGFLDLGGVKCGSPVEAARAAAAIIVVSKADDIIDVLFGKEGAVAGLHKDAVIILRSTLLPSYIQKIEKNLSDKGGAAVLVDAYFFKGGSEDLKQKTIVIASGREDAVQRAQPFLSALGDKVQFFGGESGTASKFKLVNDLLEGIHLIASVEAMFLGVRAGLHPSIVYDIISHAAGSSRIFVEMVPKMMNDDYSLLNSLSALMENAKLVLDMAKAVKFPLPLLAIAYQQLVQVSSPALGGTGSASPLKVWEQTFGANIRDAANQQLYNPTELSDQLVMTSKVVNKVGFIGLGAMGLGMASHLVGSGFSVIAYDVYKPTLARFSDLGGMVGESPGEISKDVEVLIIMVATEAQAESVLYGDAGSVSALPAGATIILSSTLSPGYITKLEQRLKDENRALKLVDAPVSGGVKKAADGTLTIMASGIEEALQCTGCVLAALSEKLYVIKGGCGAASSIKMVNQLLAGVHIASAAEAMAFGAQLSLRTRLLFEIIQDARGYSWYFLRCP